MSSRWAATVRALGLRSGEAGVVAPAAFYAALAVGATTLADVAAGALYVAAFPAGALGRLYVLTSAGRVAMAFAYATLGQRRGRARLDAAVVAGVGVLMAACAAGSSRLGPWGLTAAVLALSTLPQLLPLIGFQAAIDCLNARQAKRLLPVLAAAATVGTVAASGAARVLAGGAGTAWLMAFGALLCAIGLPLPGLLHRQASRGEAPPVGPSPASAEGAPGFFRTMYEAFGDLRRVPTARLVATYALVSALGQNLADFAWKSALKAEGGGPDAVAAELASFSVYTGVLTLLVQLLFAGAFVARAGVRGSLALPPAALCGLGALFAFAPGVPSAAALKGAEVVTRYGVGTAAADLLLTPAPAPSRLRVKALVKGAAGPLGLGLAGALVGLFGAEGPPPWLTGALVVLAGALGLAATGAARKAYADALAGALGKGRDLSDVSPHSAALVRRELSARLRTALDARDDDAALAVLAVLDGHLFTLGDVAPALAAERGEAVRRAALGAAGRVLREGEGEALLAAAPPFDDAGVEAELLELARSFGGRPDAARLASARAKADEAADPSQARLWAEALRAEAEIDRERALGVLRQAASGGAAARRAQALRALGELGDRGASRLVMQALGEPDADVFAEAARASVLLDLEGAVTVLAARLLSGPHAAAAARALSLAGPSAAHDLIDLLPTTRGEPGMPPTARASGGRSIAGTVRAARALAGLGAAACERVLRDYARLGYRARTAVCRALARVPETTGRELDPEAVIEAMDFTVSYAEGLVLARSSASPGGLLEGEVAHRIDETAARLLDLASLAFDRALIERARAALDGAARERGNALELLEQILPRGLGGRTLALFERASALPGGEPPRLDGWLERCAAFDRDGMPSTNAMSTVLERVLILRKSPLFHGLAGEELYPVAELSRAKSYAPGEAVVREGDPGDALYVVAEGSFEVERGGRALRTLGPGDVFGEMSLLDGAPRAASVVAAEGGGRALRVPREDFEALLDESPELARGVIRTLLGHLRAGAG